MAQRSEIQRLAQKWFTLFMDDKVDDSTGFETILQQDLQQAGFDNDAFASVLQGDEKQLPKVANHKASKAFLAGIDDPSALGNAIYSMWRQVTYWNIDDHLNAPDNAAWFTAAFARLVALSKPLGEIQAVTIASETFGIPMPDALVSQLLTLKVDGTAGLRNEFANGYVHEQTAMAPTARITALFTKLAAFADPKIEPLVPLHEFGEWTLKVAGAYGVQTCQGNLDADADGGLSEQLRDLLPFPHLLLFDGAPDQLQRVVADYRPTAYFFEKLVIDRHSKTLSLTIKNAAARSRVAIADDSVPALLDNLDLADDSVDLLENPAHNLTVTMRYRYQTPITVKGTLSRDDPVAGWPQLARAVNAWLAKHAPAMLDARIFGRKTPQPGDLLYAKVVFHHGSTPYSYLADASLAVGDRVEVPTSYGNNYGTIVAMDYYAPKNAPYPPEKTKRIIGKANPLVEAEYDNDDDNDEDWTYHE